MRVLNTLQARLALLIFVVALPGIVLFVIKFLEHRNEAINNAREKAVSTVETLAVVPMDWWRNKLVDSWLPEDSLAYLSDGERKIIAVYPENPQLLGLNEADLNIVALDKQEYSGGEDVTIGTDPQGRIRIFVAKQLLVNNDNRPVTVTVGVPFDRQLAAINTESLKLGAGLLLFMGLMFLITLWGIRISVLKPLAKLTKATRSLALGRHEKGIPHIGAAELVELQTLFERMAETRLQVEAQLRDSQTALQESKDYNRNLFKTSPVGLVLCTMKGELIEVNAAFATIIGRTIDDTLKQSYWAITPIKYQQEEAVQLNSLISTGAYGPYEKEYLHKDGHLVTVRQSGRLIERDGQRFIWSSVEDITRYKRLEAQIRRAQKMEALGALTEGIALDFNNVLAAIQGNLLLLKKRLSSGGDPVTDLITNILSGTQRGATLVGKLLRFSRTDTDETQILSANQFISDLTRLITESLPDSISLELELAEELWSVDVNPGDFEDALLNLVFNARDAMTEGGTLRFRTCNRTIDEQSAELHAVGANGAMGEFVQISISDTGTGIREEHRDRVFEPFFTTKQTDNGTGLGLSMVYAVVQRSGGFIELDSELGVGTTFSLYLPRTPHQA